MALKGKMSFNSQEIINDLKNGYETCYATWYNKKKIELQKTYLYDLDDINETFEEFLNKQHLDFTFEKNMKELTFMDLQMNLINIINFLERINLLKLIKKSLEIFMIVKKMKNKVNCT